MSKRRVMPWHIARREAHTIAGAAIHEAYHSGMGNRYTLETAERIQSALADILDYHDRHSASMDEVDPYREN